MDIGEALIRILVERGVKTVFGIPGDYALGLFERFEKCPEIDLVCPTGEEGAAFAASAEAQLLSATAAGGGSNISVCLVTYGVGALRLMNAIGGAYAQKSRVLVISAAPGMAERDQAQHTTATTTGTPMFHKLHHVHKTVDTQLRIFGEVCTEVGEITSAMTAISTIHKVLDAMSVQSLPGYLQIPRDQVAVPLPYEALSLHQKKRRLVDDELMEIQSQQQKVLSLQVLQWMRSLKSPVVLVGMEIQRFGLQTLLTQVLEREGWKWAESLTGKNILQENSTYLGVYAGRSLTTRSISQAVENSDGVLMIGLPLSDLDSGMGTMNLNPKNLAEVSMDHGLKWDPSHGESCRDLTCVELLKIWSVGNLKEQVGLILKKKEEQVSSMAGTEEEETLPSSKKRKSSVDGLVEAIRDTHFDDEKVKHDVIQEILSRMESETEKPEHNMNIGYPHTASFAPGVGNPVTVQTLTKAIETIIGIHSNTVMLAETGDPMFAASEIHLPKANRFLSNGYWASLGFALPGAIGAWYATKQQSRPLVLIGDGAFLTSCSELATLVRYRIPAVVVIFDNRGYGTLRPMLDGSFNDVHPVDHVALAKGYGCQWARRVWSEKEVWESLDCIFRQSMPDRPAVLSVMLDARDVSIPQRNLCYEMKKHVHQKQTTSS